MPRKKNRGFTQPMTSMDYFFDDGKEQSSPIKAVPRSATMETALRQNDSTTLIFVKSGRGSISVNADEYELFRGVLMAISDYQTYKIKPLPGETLEYVECQFDYMLYLFFMANPYFHFTSPGLGPCAVYAVVKGRRLETACLLLRGTSLPVREIAAHLCFSDEHYFSSLFRQKIGVSPLAYRREPHRLA